MIAVLIKTSKRTGIPDVVGVATQRADVETFLAGLEEDNASGRVEVWTVGKSEPDAVVYNLAEWGSE
jgi:hypothetical protein